MKVWMLTGDKLETAESIGYSTKLLTPEMEIIRCSTSEDVSLNFSKQKAIENDQYVIDGRQRSIIIEAKALQSIMEDETYTKKRWFLKIAKTAETVICCRVSPSQKAEVVSLIRSDDPNVVTLAIGDGANDVSMILEADIGIGLFGNEGMRAVDNSDYAIGEFRFLWHLLFKHGRWNYIRTSDMVIYFFYKNIIYTMIQVFFSVNNGFSGQTLYPEWFLTFFNMAFTAFPLVFKAITDLDVYPIDEMDGGHLRKLIPHLYYIGQRNLNYNQFVFYRWMLLSIGQGIIIYTICLFAFQNHCILEPTGESTDHWEFGMVVFTSLVLVVTNKLLITSKNFEPALVTITLVTVGFYFLYLGVTDSLHTWVMQHFTFKRLFTSLNFYSIMLLPTMICFYMDFLFETRPLIFFSDP